MVYHLRVRLLLVLCMHSHREAHNDSGGLMQVLMASDAVETEVNCTVSMFDSRGQLADTHALAFSVTPNPPGIVCTGAVMHIILRLCCSHSIS